MKTIIDKQNALPEALQQKAKDKGNPIINQAEVQNQMNDFARNIATRVYSQL